MTEYVPDGTRYRIILVKPDDIQPYERKGREGAYFLWYHTDRLYNTIGGVKQIINGAKKHKDFYDCEWRVEKGEFTWSGQEVDIYASKSNP